MASFPAGIPDPAFEQSNFSSQRKQTAKTSQPTGHLSDIPAKIMDKETQKPPSSSQRAPVRSLPAIRSGQRSILSPSDKPIRARVAQTAIGALQTTPSSNKEMPLQTRSAPAAAVPAPQKASFRFTKETLKIAQATKWETVQVTEEEAEDYFNHLDQMPLCAKDIDWMKNVSSVRLSNGKTLTGGELAGLKFYTQHGFRLINTLLNNRPESLEQTARELGVELKMPEAEKELLLHCRMICSALNKLPSSSAPEVYRGVLLRQEKLDSYRQALKEGTIVPEAHLLSTSLADSVCDRFILETQDKVQSKWLSDTRQAQQKGLPPPPKTDQTPALFVLLPKGGAKEIHEFSTVPNEKEAVFLPGSGFKVAAILGKEQIPPEKQRIYQTIVFLERM